MHISTVYLSGYSPTTPVKGHVDFDVEGTKIQVTFSDSEAPRIHEICVEAWGRKQAQVADLIRSSSPALPELPAPAPEPEFTPYEPAPEEVQF